MSDNDSDHEEKLLTEEVLKADSSSDDSFETDNESE